jgi:hypothetical protein
MLLDAALDQRKITPEDAKEGRTADGKPKGVKGCTAEYLTARGHDDVKFEYKNFIGSVKIYDGRLLSAIKHGYITIDEAIARDFITEAQAIEGGFKQAPKK